METSRCGQGEPQSGLRQPADVGSRRLSRTVLCLLVLLANPVPNSSRAIDPPPQTLLGHRGWTISVAWRPDGKQLASGSGDRTIKIWDMGTGQTLRTLSGHTNYVYCVAWNPSGTRIASASYDKTVKVWNAATGQHLTTLKGHNSAVMGVD